MQTVAAWVGKHVSFCDDCIGEKAVEATKKLQNGEILLLENVRFHAEDEGKVKQKEGESDADFQARKQAECGDCFVNDAFGAAHRAHASTSFIASYFPNDKMFGLLMEAELEALSHVVEHPQHPLLAIMGGAKV